jgi:hypothetical protein
MVIAILQYVVAAEAVNPHAFAMDDGQLFYHIGRAPHPEQNFAVSWGKRLSDALRALRAGIHCGRRKCQ